jgi:hypothetical protein
LRDAGEKPSSSISRSRRFRCALVSDCNGSAFSQGRLTMRERTTERYVVAVSGATSSPRLGSHSFSR